MVQNVKKARLIVLVVTILHIILKKIKKKNNENKVIRKKLRCFNCNHKKPTFLKQESGSKMRKHKIYR